MKNKSPYILWLPSWYPSKVDLYNGDFTQRQAKSVALFRKIIVLFLIHAPDLKNHKIEIEKSEDGNLIEWRVYYPKKYNSPKIINVAKYFWFLIGSYFHIIKQYGLPQLIHVNVIGKSAFLALILKKIKSIPYLITENWTGYYSTDPGGLHTKGYFMKWYYNSIFKNTSLFIPVSNDLGEQVQKMYPEIKYEIVPNTVDTSLFNNVKFKDTTSIKRIIHVSTLGYQKNIEGLIAVIKPLAMQRNDFELILIGPYSPKVKKEIDEDDILMKRVKLTGNISYAEVGNYMKDSDFLVMFSRYENLPCVILEALCSGLPVISTNVGGIPEIINRANGILIDSENNNELKIALEYMLDNLPQYNRNEIAESAIEKYNYKTIGQSINKIYEKYLLF
ncbi:MAG: glycosyltransferase [Chitinophagaceae bacterium]|nr:glycosyltransferase [Chitinophagaceae bacterium]